METWLVNVYIYQLCKIETDRKNQSDWNKSGADSELSSTSLAGRDARHEPLSLITHERLRVTAFEFLLFSFFGRHNLVNLEDLAIQCLSRQRQRIVVDMVREAGFLSALGKTLWNRHQAQFI
jgi:hypothetical protein